MNKNLAYCDRLNLPWMVTWDVRSLLIVTSSLKQVKLYLFSLSTTTWSEVHKYSFLFICGNIIKKIMQFISHKISSSFLKTFGDCLFKKQIF